MKKGFTLVEMLVVLVVGSLVITGAYNLFSRANKINNYESAHIKAQDSVRNVALMIEKQIRKDGDRITVYNMKKDGAQCVIIYNELVKDETDYCVKNEEAFVNGRSIGPGVNRIRITEVSNKFTKAYNILVEGIVKGEVAFTHEKEVSK